MSDIFILTRYKSEREGLVTDDTKIYFTNIDDFCVCKWNSRFWLLNFQQSKPIKEGDTLNILLVLYGEYIKIWDSKTPHPCRRIYNL